MRAGQAKNRAVPRRGKRRDSAGHLMISQGQLMCGHGKHASPWLESASGHVQTSALGGPGDREILIDRYPPCSWRICTSDRLADHLAYDCRGVIRRAVTDPRNVMIGTDQNQSRLVGVALPGIAVADHR